MTSKKFTLKYGKATLSFEIPAERILYEPVGANRPALAHLATEYLFALDHPIDSAPLRERVKPGERVAIVASEKRSSFQLGMSSLITKLS